jgi:glycosyltransferase involved in cell wall biosynthesis
MSEERTLFNLNKVFIADTILERAAGILGIAHGSVDAQLLTYFPKLCLSPEIQRKPVRVIPEGIRLEPESPGEAGAGREQLLCLLTDHPGRHSLDRRYAQNPVILNVGRLVPAKGQHRLVQAWAQSPISGVYNLVLIGGNMDVPTAEERRMLEMIEETLDRHPALAGRFCHLPSQENTVVRRLEKALGQGGPGRVPVYLCSSLKEEFGISILEAMAAGFLVLAPLRGGVPTYVEHGESGFLIDTSTAETMRTAAEGILLSQSPERLERIARQGRRFILENFGIEKIARRFAEFYLHVFREGTRG